MIYPLVAHSAAAAQSLLAHSVSQQRSVHRHALYTLSFHSLISYYPVLLFVACLGLCQKTMANKRKANKNPRNSSKPTTSSGDDMGGPPKKHAEREKPYGNASKSSSSGGATERSTLRSVPRLDGTREGEVAAVDYSQPNDLKNISEFLGIGGWYKARGVSSLTFFLHSQGLTYAPAEPSHFAPSTSQALQLVRSRVRPHSQHLQCRSVPQHHCPPVRRRFSLFPIPMHC